MVGFSSQISLIKLGYSCSNHRGNIYIADGYPKGYAMKWLNEFILEIVGIQDKNFKQETEFANIRIEYKPPKN